MHEQAGIFFKETTGAFHFLEQPAVWVSAIGRLSHISK